MDNIENKQSAGELKISSDVIAAIAKVAVLETQGISSLSEPKRIRGMFPRIKKAITVASADDFISITINVNLKYGAHIPEVCASMQNSVKENVQTMTGKAVSKVNIFVSGIDFSEDTAIN